MLQRCLAPLPSSRHLVSNGESDVTRVPCLPVSPMVNSRQMNQNRRHRHKSLPTVLLSVRVWKAIWRWVLKPNCYSSLSLRGKTGEDALVSFLSQLKRCPQPLGKWYNEDLYAYTLPHFNCKRCTHPALWTSDGCIMGRAQNMTVHHVRTMCRFTFHCCLLQFASHRRLLFFSLCCFEEVWNVLMWLPGVMKQPNACKQNAKLTF